jgi:hypothetical protein
MKYLVQTIHYHLSVFLIFLSACQICAARQIYVHAGSQSRSADGSEDRPFKTITEGLRVVRAGDTVIVREGVYRESLRMPGGQPGQPVSIQAAEGERVILSGAAQVTGWKNYRDHIYVASLDFRPELLLLNHRVQPVARLPEDGWWTAPAVEGQTIIDAANLRTLDNDLVGGEAYIMTMHGHVYFTVPIASLDRVNGTLTVIPQKRSMVMGKDDKYFLKNHPSLIDSPGDWAVLKHEDGWRIYFWPVTSSDLKSVEVPRETRSILHVDRVKHVRIAGLEVAAGARNGLEVTRSEDVDIERCIVYNHGGRGVQFRDVNDITVRRSIVLRNEYGVVLIESKGIVVEENEIGYNDVDGLIISWKTSDVTVRRNYIHHHLLWGHPDNIQLYQGVTNVRLIDNLLLGAGQGIMMQETSDGLIQGNMIIGCMAIPVIFGHKNAENYRVHNNTVAFGGGACMSLTAHHYDVQENIFVTGQGSPMYSVIGVRGYDGGRNVFFNARGIKGRPVMVSDRGWHRTFREYRSKTRYDRGSVFGDPRFRNAPDSFAVVDNQRLSDCTRERLYLRKGLEMIRLGDFVEVNFDGVLRRIVNRGRETITISPALPAKPLTPSLICCWGRNSDMSLDFQLQANSPGASLSTSGGPVGSTIDISAYQRGDFDADGQRDLPALPAELEPKQEKTTAD